VQGVATYEVQATSFVGGAFQAEMAEYCLLRYRNQAYASGTLEAVQGLFSVYIIALLETLFLQHL
jgi:hypothetical protein